MPNPTPRVGRKPKRLYVRFVRFLRPEDVPPPGRASLESAAGALDAAGRLVASGPLTEPAGELTVFRAEDRGKAEFLLRSDPVRKLPVQEYAILDWKPERFGAGVNLEPPPGRGAGRLTQLHTVAVAVRDRERAISWYRDVLGFLVLHDDPESGYVHLGLSAAATGLSLVVPRREWGEPLYSETVRRVGTATGIILRTDSARALQLRLEHAGARITQPVSPEPWGRHVLRFEDPDGNEFLAFEPTDDAPGEASGAAAESVS